MPSPNGSQANPLRSERVTQKQERIAARYRGCVETCHRVRDDIADGILALHDFDNAELIPARERHGEHHPFGGVQLLADGHTLPGRFVAERTRHGSDRQDEGEQGGQPTVQPPRRWQRQ